MLRHARFPLPPPRFPHGAQHSRAKVHPSELKPGPAVVDTHVQRRACACACVLFLTSKINKRDIPQKGDKVNRGKGGGQVHCRACRCVANCLKYILPLLPLGLVQAFFNESN